jgi:hypothetical protein
MRKCSVCGRARFWALADSRHKCKSCSHRQRDAVSAWESIWLSEAQKHQLIERFVLGVPVHRQRFRPVCGANTTEKVYRLLRLCRAVARAHPRPGMRRNHLWKRPARPRGWGALGKVIVFGIIKRSGKVNAMPIASHDRKAVMQQIDTHTREGSFVLHRPAAGVRHPEAAGRPCSDSREGPTGPGAITSTASRASGTTPRIGCIPTAADPANTSTSTWVRFATASITVTKSCIPCDTSF